MKVWMFMMISNIITQQLKILSFLELRPRKLILLLTIFGLWTLYVLSIVKVKMWFSNNRCKLCKNYRLILRKLVKVNQKLIQHWIALQVFMKKIMNITRISSRVASTKDLWTKYNSEKFLIRTPKLEEVDLLLQKLMEEKQIKSLREDHLVKVVLVAITSILIFTETQIASIILWNQELLAEPTNLITRLLVK